MSWKTPKVREVALGGEINAYVCARLKSAAGGVPAGAAPIPRLAVALDKECRNVTTKMACLAAVAAVALLCAGPARADADAAHGEAIFKQTCGVCHSTQIGVNQIGPSLFGVVGRPVAVLPDYVYSDKLKSVRQDWGTWDDTTLDSYLLNPRLMLHGVKMAFKGLPQAQDRADVIAYLRTLK